MPKFAKSPFLLFLLRRRMGNACQKNGEKQPICIHTFSPPRFGLAESAIFFLPKKYGKNSCVWLFFLVKANGHFWLLTYFTWTHKVAHANSNYSENASISFQGRVCAPNMDVDFRLLSLAPIKPGIGRHCKGKGRLFAFSFGAVATFGLVLD